MVGCRVCAVCAFCNVVTRVHSLAQARLRWGPALQQPSRRHVLFSSQCVGERKRRDGKLFSSGAAHSESSDSSAGSTLPFSDGILSVPAWHVGEPEYDNYMTDLAAAPDILRRFAELDYKARLQIMRITFNTKPQHPNAWMERCISRSFEDRDKRRSNPYRRGSTLGTSPVAGHADATPASQGSACSGNSPSKPGSNLFLRPDRSPRQTSSLATSPVQGPAQRALSSARSEVEPLEWICMLVVSWKIAALC